MDLLTPLALAALFVGLRFAGRHRLRPAPRPPSSRRRPHSYRVARVLGIGGQARVLEAQHRRTGRSVALKVATEGHGRKHLRQEAQYLRRLRDRRVVDLVEEGVTPSSRPWLALELIEGVTLRALLDTRGPLPPRRVAYYLAEIVAALRVVHGAGLVHGDLKPSNVMIAHGADGVAIKLVDFGLARPAGAAPAVPGMAVGTPAFMAPEAVFAEPATAESDVYALGVIAFQLLTGRLPFRGDDPSSVMRKHVLVAPPELDALIELPSGFAGLLERCLEKRAALRPTLDHLETELSYLTGGWNDEAEAAWWHAQLGASAPLPLLRRARAPRLRPAPR